MLWPGSRKGKGEGEAGRGKGEGGMEEGRGGRGFP